MNSQKHDHIKWYIIGFLSALGVVAVSVVLLIYFLTPLVKIDESTGRVQLLGGFIDVQARDVITQLSKQGSFVFGTIEGVEKIPANTELVVIKFGGGTIRVDYNEGNEVNWDCDGAGKNAKLTSFPEEKSVSLDFSSAFVDCDVSIPPNKVKIEGLNGEVEVRKMQADVDVKLTSGKVSFEPIEQQAYDYDINVASGTIDELFQTADEVPKKAPKGPLPIKVKVDLKIGSVESLD
jgi:hypothetical protein